MRSNAAFCKPVVGFQEGRKQQSYLGHIRVEVVGFTRRICDHFMEPAKIKQVKIEIGSTAKNIMPG
jgi:hypothetical protein